MFNRIKFLFCFSEWEDFYTDGSSANENFEIKTNDYNDLSAYENAYVHDCTFKNISGSGNGGVISYSKNSKLLVEHSSFNTCSTAIYGGAIYFSDEGQCVLSSVCGVKCNTGDGVNYGQFCYVDVANNEKYKNYIIDSSVTLTKQTNSFETIRHENGDFSCKGVNVSNNEVNQVSGIMIYNPSTSFISFSSFRNNRAKGSTYSYICIDFVSNSHQMNQTNIIENNQDTSDCGILYAVNTELT